MPNAHSGYTNDDPTARVLAEAERALTFLLARVDSKAPHHADEGDGVLYQIASARFTLATLRAEQMRAEREGSHHARLVRLAQRLSGYAVPINDSGGSLVAEARAVLAAIETA